MLSFTLFKVREQVFAYETESVSETIKVERIFTVPQAPPYIKGVINLRNRVIPLIDLGELLWGNSVESDTAVVLDVGGETVGVLVDRVVGITELEEGEIKGKEGVEIADMREDLLKGIFEREDSVVFILDLSPVVEKKRRKGSKSRRKGKSSEVKEVVQEKEDQEGYVIFPLGEEWYAVPVEVVREIVDYPEQVSPIPKSPDYIEGVFLLRGEKLVLVSLKKLLGIPSDAEEQRVLVLKFGGVTVGTAVDDVKEIRWVPRSSIMKLEGGVSEGVIVLDSGSRLASILNPQEIFDSGDIEGVVEAEEEEEVQREVRNMKSFVRFNLGDVDMAVPIEKVKEVIEVDEVSPLPGAPHYVRGMFNLRNSVIAVIDLPRKLGVKTDEDSNKVIVLEDIPAGLVVTRLRGIFRTEEENIQPAEDLAGVEESLLEGIIKTEDGGVIFLLDVDKVVKEEDIKLLREEVVEDGRE